MSEQTFEIPYFLRDQDNLTEEQKHLQILEEAWKSYTKDVVVFTNETVSKAGFIAGYNHCNDELRTKVEHAIEDRESLRNFHDNAMIELAKLCGEDLSDEPRFKWVYIEVSSLVDERNKLKAENEILKRDIEAIRG